MATATSKKLNQRKHKVKRKSVGGNSVQKQAIQSKRKQIRSKEAYDITMKEINSLMKRGEGNLTSVELDRLRTLAEAAEAFEDINDPLPLPGKLPEMIRIRMFQMRLSQRFTAKLLGVSDAKFSLIMNGKQKPDIYFIKAIHQKLNVDGNKILDAL